MGYADALGNADELGRTDEELFKRGDAGRLHVGTLLIFAGPAPSADEVRTFVRARLGASPRTRQRIVSPPIGPMRWIDDPSFNLDYHLRRAALPRPGTDELLERNVARILSTTLDVTKPLWELWVIEGLSRDRWALLAKTSYALAERGRSVDLVTALFDQPPSREAQRWLPRPAPSAAQLSAMGVTTLAGRALHAPLTLANVGRHPLHAATHLTSDGWAAVGSAIRTARRRNDRPLRSSGGQQRAFSSVTIPLDELRIVRDRFGGTIHDAVVASIAGGVRRWRHAQGLRAHGLSVSALVPVAVREHGEVHLDGVEMPLPLHRADPVESLRAVQIATARALENREALGAGEISKIYRFAAPTILADATRLAAAGNGRSILIANVPGPREARGLLGRELLAVFPIVPLTGERGLAAAAVSYAGSVRIGLTADPITIPDVDELSAEITRTAEFLVERARTAARPSRGPKRPAVTSS